MKVFLFFTLQTRFTPSPAQISEYPSVLFGPLASQYNQSYYQLVIYAFLALALCGVLAGLAYLFSISTAQETEKRSEYECGFAPFDSATRLPFDVHFYLVGILFLIFDVEVALLFPWVLSLRTVGWFGFYLMLAFLFILTLGFLYEWKRGALIWPSRSSVRAGALGASVASFAADTRDICVGAFYDFLNAAYAVLCVLTYVFTETGHVIFVISVLYAAAHTYEKVVHIELPEALSALEEDNIYARAVLSGEIPAETAGSETQENLPVVVDPSTFVARFIKNRKDLSNFYVVVSVIFVYSFFVSSYLCTALIVNFAFAYLFEKNPFFPIKTLRDLAKLTVLLPRLALISAFAFTAFWAFTFYKWTRAAYRSASQEFDTFLRVRPQAKLGLTTRLDNTVHTGTWDLLRDDKVSTFQLTPHVKLRWRGKKDVFHSKGSSAEYEVSVDYLPQPRWIYEYRPRFMFTEYLYSHPHLKAAYNYIDDNIATFSWGSVTAVVTFAAVAASLSAAYYLGRVSAQTPQHTNTWFTWRRGFFATYYQTVYQFVKLSWFAFVTYVAGYMMFHMDVYPQEKIVTALFDYQHIMQGHVLVFGYTLQLGLYSMERFVHIHIPTFFVYYLPEFLTVTVPEFFTVTLVTLFSVTVPEFFTVTLPPALSSNFVLVVEYAIYFLPRIAFDVFFGVFLFLLGVLLWLVTLLTVTIPGVVALAVDALISFVTYVRTGLWWIWVKTEHEISWHYKKHAPSEVKYVLSDIYSHPFLYAFCLYSVCRTAKLLWTHSGPYFAPRFTVMELFLFLYVFPLFEAYAHLVIYWYFSSNPAKLRFNSPSNIPKPRPPATGLKRNALLVAISAMDPEVRDALYIWISHNGYTNAIQIIGPYTIYCTLALFVVTVMFADVSVLLVKGHLVSYKNVDRIGRRVYAKNSPFPRELRERLIQKNIFYMWIWYITWFPGGLMALHWHYIHLPFLKNIFPFTHEEFPSLGVDITHEMDKYHWKAPYFYYYGTLILLVWIAFLVWWSVALSRDIQLFATEPAARAYEKRMRALRRKQAQVGNKKLIELRVYRALIENSAPAANQADIDAKVQVELNEKNEAADAVWTSKMNEKDATPVDQKTLDEKLALHSIIYKHVFTKNEVSSGSKSAPFFVFLLAPLGQLQSEFYSAVTTLSSVPMLAEGFLFTLICYVLVFLSMSLGEDHQKRDLTKKSWKILCLGLLALCVILGLQLVYPAETSPILGGYFASSPIITLFKLITLLSVLFVLDASSTFMTSHRRHLLEYPLMLTLTTLFMLLLISANHIMSAFLSLVGFSLGLYVLILYDADKKPAREAGVKYYYLSALSSGLILYGLLVTYVLVGTGNFDEMFFTLGAKTHLHSNRLLQMATLFVLVGFFFKLSAFPGHLWAADVYEGSPAPVTAFFMLPVKIAVLGAFIRVFSVALSPLAAFWLPVLTVAVIASIIWGAFASVQEKKVRRFLAYASINQMGFLLMGLTSDSDEGFQAAVVYIGVYAVMTCAFLTVFLSARRQDGAELLYISDFRTLARENWVVGWSLGVILFSMAGIPPLGGFFAKYFVLLHAFEKGLILEVVVGLATSLISTYYYLRVIKTINFEQPEGALHVYNGVSGWKLTQLAALEGALWGFIIASPYVLQYTYSLALTHGPALF